MAFYVGQKVVCVDASPAWDGFWLPIKLNETYVIERIEHHIGGLGFILCGVRFPARNNFKADWLRSCRFRPIVSRKTDITIFEEIRDGKRRVADPMSDDIYAWDRIAVESGAMKLSDYVEKWGNE